MINFRKLVTKQVDAKTNKVTYTLNMEVLLIPFQIILWILKYFNIINCTWKEACIPTFIALGWIGLCLLAYIPAMLFTRTIVKKTPWQQLQKAVTITETEDEKGDQNAN